MKRGYIRPVVGNLEDRQAARLAEVGLHADAVWMEELSQRKLRAPEPADLKAREKAIRQLRKGDQLVVCSLPILAVSVGDFAQCMALIASRGASVLDLEDGAEYRWSKDALHAMEAIARFDLRRKQQQTARARAALEHARTERGVKVGRLPSLTGKKREAALNDWRNSPLSVAALAKKYGVAQRTLYNEFGTRSGEPPPPRRKRRPK